MMKKSSEKKRYGEFAGIPYDFRTPTWKRARQRMWNEKDRRVFTPKSWGVGWTLNFRNPRSWIVVAAIVVYVVAAFYLAGSFN